MQMTNSHFRTPVDSWVRDLACWFRVTNTFKFTMMEAYHFTQMLSWHCILNAFKTVYLILMRGVFVNLDCNLQTVEAKPEAETAIDVGGSAKQTTR